MRSLRDLLCELTGESPQAFDDEGWWQRLAAWPPDVFAVTSALLEESGAYRLCVSPPPCAWPPCAYRAVWNDEVIREGAEWRACLDADEPLVPLGVALACAELRGALAIPVRALGSNADLEADARTRHASLAVFRLHALADEACVGFGVTVRAGEDAADSVCAEYRAKLRLLTSGSLSTFDTDRVRVLPKLRTPAAGITLRSLAHNLSAHRSEIAVSWNAHAGDDFGLVAADERRLNLLLVPWPYEIEPRAFAPTQPMWRESASDYLSFQYAPPERPEELAACLERAIRASHARGAAVHGVVLPEAATTLVEFAAAQEVVDRLGVGFLLAGTRARRRNEARLALRGLGRWQLQVQPKHHRWCLDGEQIHQYHLGGALHPTRRYWEDIEVPERQLRFASFGEWLTLCHLICEDLARLDPVSDVIRSAGPNLVIALLLDGPQLEARWPGRYASVLADDPGSSVLTLTSLGMVRRCLPRGRAPSRVIALWKDPRRGVHELALDPGARALLLSICGYSEHDWTADGRRGRDVPSLLVLSAVEQIAW